MASGYEKAACGIDPNTGWGKPRPVQSAILTCVAVIAALLHYGWLFWSFFQALAACLSW